MVSKIKWTVDKILGKDSVTSCRDWETTKCRNRLAKLLKQDRKLPGIGKEVAQKRLEGEEWRHDHKKIRDDIEKSKKRKEQENQRKEQKNLNQLYKSRCKKLEDYVFDFESSLKKEDFNSLLIRYFDLLEAKAPYYAGYDESMESIKLVPYFDRDRFCHENYPEPFRLGFYHSEYIKGLMLKCKTMSEKVSKETKVKFFASLNVFERKKFLKKFEDLEEIFDNEGKYTQN